MTDDVKLNDQQWRVVELLAKQPRPNIYFDSKEQWKACVTPTEIFERTAVSSLFASGIVESYNPTVIARPHLRLTDHGRKIARGSD